MKTHLPALLAAVCAGWTLVPSVVAQAKDTPRPAPRPGQSQPGSRPEAAPPPSDESAPAPASESDFVQSAAKGGISEAHLAELAAKKAHDQKVKEFAEMLVRDHTAANQELKTIARDMNIRVADLSDSKAEQKHRDLNAKAGAEFDRAFIEETRRCHEKDIALFEAGKKVAKSQQLTAFIDKTLPVLRNHAEKLEELGPAPPKPGTRPGEPRPGPDPTPDSKPKAGTARRNGQPRAGNREPHFQPKSVDGTQ